MTRRDFLKGTGIAGAACLVAPLLSCSSSEGGYDTIIQNGTVYDGTLAEPAKADVGIVRDRIVAIGNLTGSARKVIDARNCIVTPGFIDVHDHSDLSFLNAGDDRELARTLPVWSENQAALIQGVTTVISGNCGYGYTDMNAYYEFLASLPFGNNTYYLTPHGYLRQELFGSRQPAELTSAQLDSLKAKVAQEMEKGAIGMSTGLAYAPGYLATKQELIELGKVVRRYNGIYVSHIRHDGPEAIYGGGNADVMVGIQEAIDVGRQADIPVQISHIHVYVPSDAQTPDQIIRTIEDARREGIDVTADQYPYMAGATVLSVLVPSQYRTPTGIISDYWTEPGRTELLNATANTLKSLSADLILIPSYKNYRSMTLREIAAAEALTPEELFVEMVCVESPPAGIFFFMDEAGTERLMPSPFIFTASDGAAVPDQNAHAHPRTTGTFARKLRVYAMDRKLMSLQEAILSMTSRPAEKFGLKERGRIAPDYFADVAVIDPARLRDRSTYSQPSLYSEGVLYVFVNGVLGVENGSFTGSRNGRAIRRS
jgi:N-acyl-D-aspartate/D-glutamate deacylase